jgi:ABC-type ATPase involved in cell division/GNAT superfamily N-acetyltransferase
VITVDVELSTIPSASVRARQLSAAFDVPSSDRQHLSWQGSLPLDEQDWTIGLIVGPSGAGKSTLLRNVFDEPRQFDWGDSAVVDDFADELSIEDVTAACSAVGFNTIPAWLRPHSLLSTGERFRVEMARSLAESSPGDVIVLDEFTSVVDRQVAQIGAHAVAKWLRKRGDRRFVAASCHYDIIDWLQPDWVLEPATMTFAWRSLQPRPALDVTIGRVSYAAWRLFAPFHYLTADLNKAARCYALFAGTQPAAFAALLHRPHKSASVKGVSRLVTLPDWQGLGLAFVLVDHVAAALRTRGQLCHTYPAHPSLMRAFDRSPCWQLRVKPMAATANLRSSSLRKNGWVQGVRPNATFRYVGEALSHADADRLLAA